jgi:putative spermidine/putrescine transport system permease protein
MVDKPKLIRRTASQRLSTFTAKPRDRVQTLIQEYKGDGLYPIAIASPYLIYMLALFVIPISYMLLVSFYSNIPGGTMESALTISNYIEILNSEVYRTALVSTVKISVLTTLLTIILSYPIAYSIVFSENRYSSVLILLVIVPMLVGDVVRIFGWLIVMREEGIASQILAIFNIEYTLLKTEPGLVLALTSVLMPFAILILLGSLYSIEKELIEAAHNLGGTRLQTFSYVTFPLSISGVIGATLITYVLAMGTFATAIFIGMPQVPMLSPFVYNAATTDLNWPLASALSFILLVTSLLLIYAYTKVSGRAANGGDAL